MGYMKYFDVKSFFQSQQLLNTFNINLEKGMIGDIPLSEEDRQDLERAVVTSNAASQNGSLAGVYNLVNTVEGLSGKYGRGPVWEHHHKELGDFVEEVATDPKLAKHYKLEGYSARRKPTLTTTHETARRNRRG